MEALSNTHTSLHGVGWSMGKRWVGGGSLCSHEEQQQGFEVDTGSHWEPREQIEQRWGAAWRNVSLNWLQGPCQKGVTAACLGELLFLICLRPKTGRKMQNVLDFNLQAAWWVMNELLMLLCTGAFNTFAWLKCQQSTFWQNHRWAETGDLLMLQLCSFRPNSLCSTKIFTQKKHWFRLRKHCGLALNSHFASPPSQIEMVWLPVVTTKMTGNVSSSS